MLLNHMILTCILNNSVKSDYKSKLQYMNRGKNRRRKNERTLVEMDDELVRGLLCPALCHESKTDDSLATASEKLKPESREF